MSDEARVGIVLVSHSNALAEGTAELAGQIGALAARTERIFLGTGIINVASTAGFQPLPSMAVYGASKAFVLSFSEALWQECKGTGVRVLALCPGATETEFFTRTGEEFLTDVRIPDRDRLGEVASRGEASAERRFA